MTSSHLEKIKKLGHRITQARAAIINLMENTQHPLTASSIQKLLNKIGVSINITTVYRELDFLLREHIIEKVPLFDTELHYEITGRPHHHHVMCTTCKNIKDILLQSEKELLEEAHHISSYDIRRHSLAFFGVCPSCQ